VAVGTVSSVVVCPCTKCGHWASSGRDGAQSNLSIGNDSDLGGLIMMKRFLRAAIFMACFLTAGSAFAAGGACPTGSNYLNSSTMAMVTLSSLGVTNCYYVAANGSDSNSGSSETSPWAHIPGMPNCSGNCATLQASFGSGDSPTQHHAANIGFIFRGGDTWHFGANTTPSTGGTLSWPWNGNTGALSYIGVDQGWSASGTWARPIFTGDNAINAATNLTSCSYQVGSNNRMTDFSSAGWFILDNFEMVGFCQSSTGAPGGMDQLIDYGNEVGPDYYLNLYVHGWSHVQWSNPNSPITCNSSSDVCANIRVFAGSGNGASGAGETLIYDVIDGSDSDPTATGQCYCGWWNVSYSVIRYTSQGIVRDFHLFHDNLVEYQYDNGHANVFESVGDAAGNNGIYNNIFRHLTQGQIGGEGTVGIWPQPSVGTTDYLFGNVIYDEGNIELLNIGQNGQDQGTLAIFNNTIEDTPNSNIMGWVCPQVYAHPFTAANNQYITNASSAYSTGCSSGGSSYVSELLMSHATAATDGYTASQTYAYSPTSASSPTMTAGTNEQSFCSALLSAAASDSTLSDAATACQSDTRYACTYNSSIHTVSCPARAVVTRPTILAWAQGAYQGGTQTSSSPNPPTNLTATVN
jgi:hypothetical protein